MHAVEHMHVKGIEPILHGPRISPATLGVEPVGLSRDRARETVLALGLVAAGERAWSTIARPRGQSLLPCCISLRRADSGACAIKVHAPAVDILGNNAAASAGLLAPNAALQAIDSDDDIGPLEDLHQPIKKSFGIMRSRLEIFLKHPLRVAHSLEGQLLIGHETTWRSMRVYRMKIGVNCFAFVQFN
jgi:hypothetical protein